jgi:hypothetical protein
LSTEKWREAAGQRSEGALAVARQGRSEAGLKLVQDGKTKLLGYSAAKTSKTPEFRRNAGNRIKSGEY